MNQILQPSLWALPAGYSNGIIASGRQVYIAGQIGWNAAGQFDTDSLARQVGQALRNIVAILDEAGGLPEHLVRLTWYVTSCEEYRAQRSEIGAVYREVLGKHFPVMSVVQIAALVEARARVEIEATAVIP